MQTNRYLLSNKSAQENIYQHTVTKICSKPMNQSLEQQVKIRCSLQVDRENCVVQHQETPDGHTATCNDIDNYRVRRKKVIPCHFLQIFKQLLRIFR